MKPKTFNSKHKAIKMPNGAAGEYSKYSCGFYVGCSNGCTYCYLKKHPFKNVCGGNVPTLKKCFKDENHAFEVFKKEMQLNINELQKHGLFLSFTTDPMLVETISLTTSVINECFQWSIPVKLLTKRSDWVNGYIDVDFTRSFKNNLAIGFTLTGNDELEPNASTNAERIEAMRKLHNAGFKTWSSIEPVLDLKKSLQMINLIYGYCDLIKVGLLGGSKFFDVALQDFVELSCKFGGKIYFKDSLLKQARIKREYLPSNCVGRDYNMFNQ